MTQKTSTLWLVPAVAAGALTFVALGIGGWELYCGKNIEAASWVMAAGGLGLIVFSSVQLHREARREADRLAAARAKLKPAAWLARRTCERGVIQSDGGTMQLWVTRWYSGTPPTWLEMLEARMRETVALAAEVGEDEVDAADKAFDACVKAANILSDLNTTLGTAQETTVVQAAMPKARQAAQHLAAAASALGRLVPRGTGEPAVPANPKFSDER
jgi:hypothetical protein